jgi:type I restriction enzyme M protein
MLLRQNTVEAVLALPERSFLPYTAIKASILLVRRGGETRSVRMVNIPASVSAKPGKEGAGSIEVSLIEAAARLRQPTDGMSSWDVSVEQLEKVDFDLTAVKRDESSLDLFLGSLRAEIAVRPLGEICDIMAGRAVRSEDLLAVPPQAAVLHSDENRPPDTERGDAPPPIGAPSADSPIPYVRIKDVTKGVVSKGSSWLGPAVAANFEGKWRLCAGDILLSRSGTIGRVGMVRDSAVGAVAASGFFVIRVSDTAVDPHYLLEYLQSAQCTAWLEDRARGSGVRHLSSTVVRELPVPVPPLQLQERIAGQGRRHGVDPVAYLAELLTEDRAEPVAVALNTWVDSCLLTLDRQKDSSGIETDLQLLEHVGDSSCPVNICEECGRPYYLDYDSQYVDGPHDYQRGIARNCLACWLAVGPSSETIDSLRGRSPLVPWALAFRQAVAPLKGISRVSDAGSLLNVLQSVRSSVSSAGELLGGHPPSEERARRTTRELLAAVDRAARRLLDDIRLTVTVIYARSVGDGETDIALRVANDGKLPLRDLAFTTVPKLRDESAYLSYQLPGESDAIQFIGCIPSAGEDLGIELRWTGRTLDGTRFAGERQLSIPREARPARDQEAETDLGPSPYICGSEPVKPERDDVFFGREEELQKIRRMVIQRGNVVLLEGNRRAGKSSILWHLEGKGAIPGWVGIYCSFQGGDSASARPGEMTQGHGSGAGDVSRSSGGAALSTAGVFRLIASEIAKSLRKLNGSAILPDGTILDENRKLGVERSVRNAISEEAPFADFREYVELTLETLAKQDLGLLLLLDEFDKLQEGIDKGVTSAQVPENIRFLVQTYSRCSAVLTGSRRLKRMREEYWSALFGLGTQLHVSSLPKEAAQRLVTEPVKGRLTYSRDAVELAYTLTAGQPYLLQCLCNRVFDLATSTGRSITVDQVKAASEVLVQDNEHFASLWDYTKFDRRRFLLALIGREAKGPDPLRLGVIEERLADHGVDVKEESLIADLFELQELELVDLHPDAGGATYTLRIPLMGAWLERKDFEVLKARARAECEDTDG